MEELEIKEIEFKTSRGVNPTGKRYKYNTLIIFHVDNNQLETGLTPISYLNLKKMLGLNLFSFERVMENSMKKKFAKNNIFTFFNDKFIRPKLEILFSEIDKVVIDTLNIRIPAILGYELLSSIYLINNKRINNFDCCEAAIMAKIAKKKIYICNKIFEERDIFEKEKIKYQKRIIIEREKREDLTRRIYG